MENKLIHLGIDWEDFSLICFDNGLINYYKIYSKEFITETKYLLNFLENQKINCTFFCNARTAEVYPSLAKLIALKGHQIASHGYQHVYRDSLNDEDFLEDCLKSKKILEEITSKKIIGYRSPYLSLNKKNYISSLKILCKAGYSFDSSITFGTLDKIKSIYPNYKDGIIENISIKPLFSLKIFSKNINLAGGSIWRLVPSSLILFLIKFRLKPKSFSLYFHPYEFGKKLKPQRALGENVSKLKLYICYLRWNLGRKKIESLIIRINKLNNVKFNTYK